MKESPQARARLETTIAILLGLAAVLVAVTSYQGSLRDGDSIKSFNEGIRAVNDANGFFNEAVQTQTRDQALFLEYAKAIQGDDADLAEYLKSAIMDETLQAATKEWEDDDSNEILTPLAAPAYGIAAQAEGEKLTKVTDAKFAEARSLDEQGDDFNLVGVIVATALFFLGIAGVADAWRTKLITAGLGALTFFLSFGLWLTV